MADQVISHAEMCLREQTSLQQGMNFEISPTHSVILMSQRSNAPYNDELLDDGKSLVYEGHDVRRDLVEGDPKDYDQPRTYPSGKLTQNGKFHQAAQSFKAGTRDAEKVRVYDKIKVGIWSYAGLFQLIDSWTQSDGKRQVFKFRLELMDQDEPGDTGTRIKEHSRLIPSSVKVEVWKRDGGKCVICGETDHLHFDHDIPYSKGGTSLTASNVRLLCARHNLSKGARIQ